MTLVKAVPLHWVTTRISINIAEGLTSKQAPEDEITLQSLASCLGPVCSALKVKGKLDVLVLHGRPYLVPSVSRKQILIDVLQIGRDGGQLPQWATSLIIFGSCVVVTTLVLVAGRLVHYMADRRAGTPSFCCSFVHLVHAGLSREFLTHPVPREHISLPE